MVWTDFQKPIILEIQKKKCDQLKNEKTLKSEIVKKMEKKAWARPTKQEFSDKLLFRESMGFTCVFPFIFFILNCFIVKNLIS